MHIRTYIQNMHTQMRALAPGAWLSALHFCICIYVHIYRTFIHIEERSAENTHSTHSHMHTQMRVMAPSFLHSTPVYAYMYA